MARPELHSDVGRAGVFFFSAGIVGLLLNAIAESLYPGYSVSRQALSDLGATTANTAPLWNASLIVYGILVLLGSYLYLRDAGRRGVFACYLIAGVGPIVVGFAPENTNLIVHSLGALAHFIFGGVSAVLTFRFTATPFRYFSLLLGVITLVSTALFLSSLYLGLGMGGMERMIVYPWEIWLVALGAYLLGSRGPGVD